LNCVSKEDISAIKAEETLKGFLAQFGGSLFQLSLNSFPADLNSIGLNSA